MKPGFGAIALGSLLAIVGLLALLYDGGTQRAQTTLHVLCAAGMREPVKQIIEAYQREYPHVQVVVDYSGSGYLLGKVEIGHPGDLFLVADDFYIEKAVQGGHLRERLAVATIRPVLAVRQGMEDCVTSLESLLDPELRIGLGSPGGPAIGEAAKAILARAGMWQQVHDAVQRRGVFKATVEDLAADVLLGSIDAAILFDLTLNLPKYRHLHRVEIPDELNEPNRVTLGVLAASRQPTQALHLARYITARDRGLPHFRGLGIAVADGDKWADQPRIKLLCGGVLRPAVEQTVKQFEAREGVLVDRNYNGCGILLGSIDLGERPDAYFACHTTFLEPVHDLFVDAVEISRTPIVIAVPKGNPAGIRSLADLADKSLRSAQPGASAKLKIGVANARQSALGDMTERLLKKLGYFEAIQPSITAQVPTADMLVTQLQVRSLDAAIVFEANARRAPEHIEIITITEAAEVAVQPVAIGKSSDHKHLTARLIEAIRTSASRERFIASGFEWLDQPPSAKGTAPPTEAPTAAATAHPAKPPTPSPRSEASRPAEGSSRSSP